MTFSGNVQNFFGFILSNSSFKRPLTYKGIFPYNYKTLYMKGEHLFVLGLVSIALVTVVAVHYANKGHQVELGPPFFKAKLN